MKKTFSSFRKICFSQRQLGNANLSGIPFGSFGIEQETGFRVLAFAEGKSSPRNDALLLYFALILLTFIVAPLPARAAAEIGQPAPALTATTLDGQAFDLAALKGKVVLVHFWATWCAPCQKEMPALDAFYRAHREQGVAVIAISTDRARAADDVRMMMHPFAFPAALWGAVVKNGFGMPAGIPVTYLVDSAGFVRTRFTPDRETLSQNQLDREVLPFVNRGG